MNQMSLNEWETVIDKWGIGEVYPLGFIKSKNGAPDDVEQWLSENEFEVFELLNVETNIKEKVVIRKDYVIRYYNEIPYKGLFNGEEMHNVYFPMQ